MSALSPAANVAAAGHGSTVVVLVAIGLLVLIVTGAAGRQARRVRSTRRRSGGDPGRASVVGIVLLGLVLGATVAGDRIAHALVTALVTIGHALIGMLP